MRRGGKGGPRHELSGSERQRGAPWPWARSTVARCTAQISCDVQKADDAISDPQMLRGGGQWVREGDRAAAQRKPHDVKVRDRARFRGLMEMTNGVNGEDGDEDGDARAEARRLVEHDVVRDDVALDASGRRARWWAIVDKTGRDRGAFSHARGDRRSPRRNACFTSYAPPASAPTSVLAAARPAASVRLQVVQRIGVCHPRHGVLGEVRHALYTTPGLAEDVPWAPSVARTGIPTVTRAAYEQRGSRVPHAVAASVHYICPSDRGGAEVDLIGNHESRLRIREGWQGSVEDRRRTNIGHPFFVPDATGAWTPGRIHTQNPLGLDLPPRACERPLVDNDRRRQRGWATRQARNIAPSAYTHIHLMSVPWPRPRDSRDDIHSEREVLEEQSHTVRGRPATRRRGIKPFHFRTLGCVARPPTTGTPRTQTLTTVPPAKFSAPRVDVPNRRRPPPVVRISRIASLNPPPPSTSAAPRHTSAPDPEHHNRGRIAAHAPSSPRPQTPVGVEFQASRPALRVPALCPPVPLVDSERTAAREAPDEYTQSTITSMPAPPSSPVDEGKDGAPDQARQDLERASIPRRPGQLPEPVAFVTAGLTALRRFKSTPKHGTRIPWVDGRVREGRCGPAGVGSRRGSDEGSVVRSPGDDTGRAEVVDLECGAGFSPNTCLGISLSPGPSLLQDTGDSWGTWIARGLEPAASGHDDLPRGPNPNTPPPAPRPVPHNSRYLRMGLGEFAPSAAGRGGLDRLAGGRANRKGLVPALGRTSGVCRWFAERTGDRLGPLRPAAAPPPPTRHHHLFGSVSHGAPPRRRPRAPSPSPAQTSQTHGETKENEPCGAVKPTHTARGVQPAPPTRPRARAGLLRPKGARRAFLPFCAQRPMAPSPPPRGVPRPGPVPPSGLPLRPPSLPRPPEHWSTGGLEEPHSLAATRGRAKKPLSRGARAGALAITAASTAITHLESRDVGGHWPWASPGPLIPNPVSALPSPSLNASRQSPTLINVES
ncbi:uncharacterized protein BXZ73DRAFT_78887 [Epithele typhae]|uniref:uncharacterized protein n=1 Tax=Epithele typhae TaxID=378194 RepID=UPI002007A14D|nr:uncharacterized protein BXZ73DRAFT_78887 [Epithele typhae]KAH9925908.1 hypothetical protein BXZ73DRAFT_78887 [Epithele typhae]